MKVRESRGVYLGIIILLYIVCTFVQYQLSPVAQAVMDRYGLTTQQFSLVFSAPMIPAILFSIPAGLLMDRFGVRPVIVVGTVFSFIGIVMRPFVESFTGFYLSMLLSGVVIAFINATIAKIIGQRFPLTEVGKMVGLVVAGGTIGTVMGPATAHLFPNLDMAFQWPALVMGVALILVLFFFHTPDDASPEPQAAIVSPLQGLGTVARSRSLWLLGLAAVLIMPLKIALSSYLPLALSTERQLSEATGASAVTLVLFGYLLGSAFGGRIVRGFPGPRPYLLTIGLLGGLAGAFGWLAPEGVLLSLLMLATGFALGGIIPFLLSLPVYVPDIGPRYAGTGGGILATCQLIGAVVLPSFVYLPLSGGQFGRFFAIAGLVMIVGVLLTQALPFPKRKTLS